MQDAVSELAALQMQYKEEKRNQLIAQYDNEYARKLAGIASDNEDDFEGFQSYLKERGYTWQRFFDLLTPKNIATLGFLIFIILASSLYLSCCSFGVIALNISNKKITLNSTIMQANRFFMRFLGARVLLLLIMTVPLAVMGIAIFMLFFVNIILGVLSAFIFVLLMIA